jgi:hypothetical protein
MTSNLIVINGPTIGSELNQARVDHPMSGCLANATRSAQLLLNLASVIPTPYIKIVGGVALSVFSSIQAGDHILSTTVDLIYHLSKSKTIVTTIKN